VEVRRVSYGYLLMKIRRRFSTTGELTSEDAVPVGEPPDIARAISGVFPETQWDDASHAGDLHIEDRWFEFRILEERPVMSVGIRTSFRHESKDVVVRLCDALGLVAFDGQTMTFYAPSSVAASGEAGWYDAT
jgi:hypothetical protein